MTARYPAPSMRRAALSAAALLTALARTAAACPNCKEAPGAEAFQWGILLMIGGVLCVVAVVCAFIVRVVRRLDAANESGLAADPS